MNPSLAAEIESVTHRYGSRVALNDVTLSVSQPSIFGLVGPNGGGKTTLFRILTTLLTPSSGVARVAGADVVREREQVRSRIGIVFQHPSLDRELSVRENMHHQGHLYGLKGAELKRRTVTLLERFGVLDRAEDRVKTLSGGLQRRVELAKALLHDPRVLLLDEPSTGLDPGARMALMDRLVELRDGCGVSTLITTHLMDEADRCDRVGFLDQGRLVAVDTPAALKATIGGDVVTVATGHPAALAAAVSKRFGVAPEVIDGLVHIEWDRGHEFVPELIEAFPGEVESVTVGKPTLDDVFVRLTGHRIEEETPGASKSS